MKTKAIRLRGKSDLRLEEFDLPEMGEDEILAEVFSNSICMSSHKAVIQGSDHKRVHKDIDVHPPIIGHEMCGQILKVGSKWAHKYKPGDRFTMQTALNYQGTLWAPGYSYEFVGGNATHILIPNEVMECDCLLTYKGDAWFYGSLSEPVSCIVGAFHANYHTKGGSYVHEMGIREGGNTAIVAGLGPMGLSALDYALGCDRRPGLLVVTSTKNTLIDRARSIFSEEYAAERGVKLVYVNTKEQEDPAAYLRSLTGGAGYDDVFCMAPAQHLVELSDSILGKDGCLNFFAGPTATDFKAAFNFYNVHYGATHVVGTSGGNADDMREAIAMMESGAINPAAMITHVGGMNVAADTILNLDKIPGGKKLIYTHKKMPLFAIADLPELAKESKFYGDLAEICGRHKQLWSLEAEQYVLANARDI